jgi:hypothetical protein
MAFMKRKENYLDHQSGFVELDRLKKEQDIPFIF